MRSNWHFPLLASFALCFFLLGVQGEPKPDVAHLRGYQYEVPATPARFEPSGSCIQCRRSEHCQSELDIRDAEVPKEVPIPFVDYQTVYKDKQVRVVTDFDVRENPCPKPLQLQDEQIRVQPNVRTVEKVVVVRVPRIKENVVYKSVDRVKLVPEYRNRAKVIKVQNTRQVPDPVTVTQRKDVVRKKLVTETELVPLPVRIANIVEPDIERVDKPVQVPSINYRFCEHLQEIKVKADCPTPPPTTTTTTPRPRNVVGYAYDKPVNEWVPARVLRQIRSVFS